MSAEATTTTPVAQAPEPPYLLRMSRVDLEDGWTVEGRVARDSIHALFAHGRLRHRWIEETESLARELQQEPAARHAAALFYIRLYGIMCDIWQSTSNTITVLDDEGLGDELEAAFRALWSTLGALRSLFSRDELLLLEYQRDVESHPWLSAYRHEQPSPTHVVETRRSKLLPAQAVAFDDYRTAIEALTVRRTVDEVAAAIANRILPLLAELLAASRRCNDL